MSWGRWEPIRGRAAGLVCAGLTIAVLSGAAHGQSAERAPAWSAASGTVADEGVQVWVQGGFPRASVDLTFGLGGHFELGLRGAFDYAIQGIAESVGSTGFTAQLLTRFQFVDTPKFHVAFRFAPGVFANTDPHASSVDIAGLLVDVGLEVGHPLSEAWSVNGSLSVPVWFGAAAGGGGFVVPLLFGAGFELHPPGQAGFTLEVKAGPSFGLDHAVFTLYALAGVAFRL